tara:strand:- start:703 stop:885 length:183 start_codon:yes stop_codon:yes gene_type:complete
MTTQPEKTNLIKIPNIDRPNIDHLISRLLNERRKKQKKSILIFSVIILVFAASISFTISN